MIKNKLLFFLVAASLLLTGCNRNAKCRGTGAGEDLLPTPYTDKLDFAQKDSLDGKAFASTSEDSSSYDHYGYVTLLSCTDGDTANFQQKGYVDEANKPITIKTRFLGVNTPESTAKVEPWGKKASLFTKHILEEAQAKADEESAAAGKTVYNIALICDPVAFGERDSSGNRWLGFIWYRKDSSSKWRNLNLELVEQAYSKNQLFIDSDMCNYRKSFEKAGAAAEKCGYRVYGEEDGGFDYTTATYEYSLWGIKKHFADIGISEDGKSGVQLIVSALVVGIQGDSLYLRDVLIDDEQYEEEGESAVLSGLYAYAGYTSGICSILQNASEKYGGDGTGVGLVVRFYARATLYGGNIQLSDIKNNTTGANAFRIITADNFDKYKDTYNWSHEYKNNPSFAFSDLATSTAPIAVDESSLDKDNSTEEVLYADLLKYQYQWVSVDMTVRYVTAAEDDEQDDNDRALLDPDTSKYWANTTPNSKAYTVYAYITGKDGGKLYTNIRVDASLYPFVSLATWGTNDRFDITEHVAVGRTWHVTGYMARYFNKFQLQLANNYSAYHYITEVI